MVTPACLGVYRRCLLTRINRRGSLTVTSSTQILNSDARLMLFQRRRRWTNIKPALGERLGFVGLRQCFLGELKHL